LVLETESGRVLGVGICGVGAGELISEGVLAVEMGAVAEDLAASIHPHPTLSETVMEAAETFQGQATHLYTSKSVKK
jgi:dihydrolipoamide dehydrogenase